MPLKNGCRTLPSANFARYSISTRSSGHGRRLLTLEGHAFCRLNQPQRQLARRSAIGINKVSDMLGHGLARMVLEHEGEHASRWAAVVSISSKIGCTPQTLHEWVKKAEIDSGKRSGVPSDVSDRLKALERENRELRQANEILRKASAYFAQAELDRRYKP